MFCSMTAPDGSADLLSWQATESVNRGWQYSAVYIKGSHSIDLTWPAVFTGTASDGAHSLSFSMTVTDLEEDVGNQTISVSGIDNVTYALAHVLAVPPAAWQRKTSSFIYEEMASVIGKPVSITGDPITCHDIGQDETTYFDLITRLTGADCRFYYADNNAWRINSFTFAPQSFISVPLCSWSRSRSFLNRDTAVEFGKTSNSVPMTVELHNDSDEPVSELVADLPQGISFGEVTDKLNITLASNFSFGTETSWSGIDSYSRGEFRKIKMARPAPSHPGSYALYDPGYSAYVAFEGVPLAYAPVGYDVAFNTSARRTDVEPQKPAWKANVSSIYTNKSVADSLANKLLWLHNLATNTITAACPLNLSVRCGQYIFIEGIPWIITEVRHSMSASGAQTELAAAALGEYQW
ncbi:MAG: hypothetical protein K6G50_06045 [bacterium]|nr:hypothetical protein [bacterium]